MKRQVNQFHILKSLPLKQFSCLSVPYHHRNGFKLSNTLTFSFLDEIFNEIYGKLSHDSLDSEDSATRSLADEILEEIYGTKVVQIDEEGEELQSQISPKTGRNSPI